MENIVSYWWNCEHNEFIDILNSNIAKYFEKHVAEKYTSKDLFLFFKVEILLMIYKTNATNFFTIENSSFYPSSLDILKEGTLIYLLLNLCKGN